MNARWLLQLDDEGVENETRERVRERLWEELMEELPYEAVRATLAASRLGKHRLRRTLERLLTQATLENEAVWWELYEALPTCRRGTLELGKKVIEAFFEQQSALRQVELLQAALERQHRAPLQGYSQHQEGAAVRLALVLSLIRKCAVQCPHIELRALLEPLKRCAPSLKTSAPELIEVVRETSALIESVTRDLKDLPLPAMSAPTETNLPLPAEVTDAPEGGEIRSSLLLRWLQERLGRE